MVTRWVTSKKLLAQLSLSKEQINRIEDRTRDYDDNDSTDEEDLEQEEGFSKSLRPREREVKSSEETRARNAVLIDV